MIWAIVVVGVIFAAFISVLCFYVWILLLKPALKRAKELEEGKSSTNKNISSNAIKKFCGSCGTIVDKSSNFCRECGRTLK